MKSEDYIVALLEKSALFTGEEIFLLTSFLTRVKLRCGSCFQKEGQPVSGIGFLCKGVMKEVITDSEGNRSVYRFITKGEFIADYMGLVTQRRATIGLYASTRCKLLFIARSDLEKLAKMIPQFEPALMRVATAQMDRHKQEQLYLRMGTPMAHYHHFITHFSSIARKVSSSDISSYLNVTPSSLSRIKRNYFNALRSNAT